MHSSLVDIARPTSAVSRLLHQAVEATLVGFASVVAFPLFLGLLVVLFTVGLELRLVLDRGPVDLDGVFAVLLGGGYAAHRAATVGAGSRLAYAIALRSP